VGSSSNIYGRVNQYLNKSYLISSSNKNSIIGRSLLKDGYSSFGFIIIEYCEINLNTRETFWIQLLNPSYNVLEYGYSSTGYQHTDETKERLSKLAMGRTHKEETKLKISTMTQKEKNPFFNKTHTRETKLQIATSKSKGVVYLFNSDKELLYIFPSSKEVIKEIHINNVTLNKIIKSGNLFRGGWYLTKDATTLNPLITDKNTIEYKNIINEMIKNKGIKIAIFVYEISNKLLYKFSGIVEATKVLKMSKDTIKKYLDTGNSYKNYYFTTHKKGSGPEPS
jgi:group I intron endonuclease